MSKNVISPDFSLGSVIEAVEIGIDYQIIEHFSSHLYSSPHKAIEELVTNGFDAGAKNVEVFIGNDACNDAVIIWDDGESMSANQMNDLWQIANSPKKDMGPDRSIKVGGHKRNIIGKFGIGKLASYTIGQVIIHLCKKDNRFLLIGVDYSKIYGNKLNSSNPGQAEVRELSDLDAREFLNSIFTNPPDNFDEIFARQSWTAAIIRKIRLTKPLFEGRLRWILGNSMPLRSDFSIRVNSQDVESKLGKIQPAREWQLDSEEFRLILAKVWKEESANGVIDPYPGVVKYGKDKLDASNPSENIGFIDLPKLGKVWGSIKLFDDALAKPTRDREILRSHGFFIFVNGRLINEDDDKVFLHEPSFSAFFRSQFLIYSDGLDSDLLADRERLKVETEKTRELEVLQKAMYGLARQTRDRLEHEAYKEQFDLTASRLPTYSRSLYIEPIGALLNRGDESLIESFDIKSPQIARESLGIESRMSVLSGKGFEVNLDHPYYRSLAGQFTGKKKEEVLREFETLAVAETLTHGHLIEIGIDLETVDHIMEWRDQMFRTLSDRNTLSTDSLITRLREASYFSGEKFENAITDVLNHMGFKAKRYGEKGKKDVFSNAYGGTGNSYSLTFEAKAKTKEGSIANDDAEVGGAANHRDEAGAEHAVIIARDFAGFGSRGQEGIPAIIGECRAVGRVSIMTTECLGELLKVVREYSYPLDMIKHVFTKIESPEDKMESIRRLAQPFDHMDYSKLIDEIETRQIKVRGRDVGILDLFYELEEDFRMSKEQDLEAAISAMNTIAPKLIHFDPVEKRVALKSSASNLKHALANKLGQ